MQKRTFTPHGPHLSPVISLIDREPCCINVAESAQVRLVCTMISGQAHSIEDVDGFSDKMHEFIVDTTTVVNPIRWMQAQAVT